MKYIDILLDYFATTEQGKLKKTYLALLPYEILDKIFTMVRRHELIQTRIRIHTYFASRRRGCATKTIWRDHYIYYPFFTTKMKSVVQDFYTDNNQTILTVRFYKPCRVPYFTINTIVLKASGEEKHYSILDWKYNRMHNKLGKCL